MPMIVNIDVMLAKRKIRAKDLAEKIGISETQFSQLKNGKIKGFRFSTLNKICYYLECQPADIFEYQKDDNDILLDDDN